MPQTEGLRTTTNSRQEKPHIRPVVKNALETRGASFLFSCWERPSVTDTPVTSLKLQAGVGFLPDSESRNISAQTRFSPRHHEEENVLQE